MFTCDICSSVRLLIPNSYFILHPMRPPPHVAKLIVYVNLTGPQGARISICLDVIWLLGVSVQMFLDEMDIWISGLSSVAYPSQCGGPVQSVGGGNRTERWERDRVALCALSFLHLEHPDFRPCRRLSAAPALQVFRLIPHNCGSQFLTSQPVHQPYCFCSSGELRLAQVGFSRTNVRRISLPDTDSSFLSFTQLHFSDTEEAAVLFYCKNNIYLFIYLLMLGS